MFRLFPSWFVALLAFSAPINSSPTERRDATTEVSHALDKRAACPKIWSTVAADLKPSFAGCSQQASFAIRFAFHDSGSFSSKTPFYAPAAGGADGSLLLNSDESARSSNNPMQGYRNFLYNKYQNSTYRNAKVGAADLVQFAGSLAIASCSGGPTVKTVVGRKDSSTAAPDGLLPNAFGAGSDYNTLVSLFADKGFSAQDLAALVGAHTVSRSFAQRGNGIPPGGPQDSTPSTWDTTYFSQTVNPPRGVYRFQSDISLSNASTAAGQAFSQFAADQGAWNTAFVSAMQRLSVLGIPAGTAAKFIDCTSLITA